MKIVNSKQKLIALKARFKDVEIRENAAAGCWVLTIPDAPQKLYFDELRVNVVNEAYAELIRAEG